MLTYQFKSKRTQSLYNLAKASEMDGEKNTKDNSRKGSKKNQGSEKNTQDKETQHLINVKRQNLSKSQNEVIKHAIEKKKRAAGLLFEAQI